MERQHPASGQWFAGAPRHTHLCSVAAVALCLATAAAAAADTLERHDIDTFSALHRFDLTYGRVPDPASTLRHRWVIAGQDAASNLRIRGFAFTNASREFIDQTWTTSAGAVSQVALAWVGAEGPDGEDDRFVTAVRDSEGLLRLISWRYGQAARLDTASYLPVINNSQISIATLYNGYLATAARETDNEIRLDLWRVTGSGIIQHRAWAIAGRGSFANVVNALNGQIVAVFRDEDGRLSTQEFSISTQYDALVWSSGWVSSLAGVVKARSYNDRFIVAVFETDSGTLGLYFFDTQGDISWHAGNIQSGHPTGSITDLAVNGTGKLTTAVRQGDGVFKVIRWAYSSGNVERDTDNEESGFVEGAGSDPAVAGGSGIGADLNTHDQLATAVTDGNGNLRVTVWHSH